MVGEPLVIKYGKPKNYGINEQMISKLPDRQFLDGLFYKGDFMKKICILFFVLPMSVFANGLTFTYYDDSFYDETGGLGPGSVPAGFLTAVSDIYFYFNPFEQTLQISQTEWLSDGAGDEHIAPYSPSSFYYDGITFDNITSVYYVSIDDNFINYVLPQWKNQYDEYTITIPKKAKNINKSIMMQNRQILNSAFNHQNIRTGRDAGDTETPVYVWGQTLYSHGKQRYENAFSFDTLGTIFGSEIEVSKNLNIGFGYEYGNTNSLSENTNISMNNNSYFLYGGYKTKSFFIDAITVYNSGDYKYSTKTHTGKTDSYFASVILGKDIDFGFTPEISLRYNNIKIKDHDTYETTIKSNTWTGTIGTKYEYNMDEFSFGGKMSIDHDFYKSNDSIDILILDQNIHLSEKNKGRPLGVEFGMWTGYNAANIDLRIEYDLFVQSDYINHTGKLSFRYGF